MKKILLFSPLIILIALISFIAINSKTNDEIIEQSNMILTEIKRIVPNTKKVIIATTDTKEKKKDRKYIYNYYNKRYLVIKEITDEEDVKEIINLILDFKASKPETEISLLSDSSIYLVVLFDEKDNKLAETDLSTISIGKNKKANAANIDLSSKIYNYYEEYATSKQHNE